MTEQVAAVSADEPASASAIEQVDVITLPPGGPPRAKKKKKSQRQPISERRPMMKIESDQPKPRQRPGDQGRRPDQPPSNRKVARENALNFLPIASHPAEIHEFKLVSEYTVKLYQDHCGRAQISLYNLMHFLPIRMRQLGRLDEKGEDFLDKLEELIDARIDDIGRRMKSDLDRYRKILNDNQMRAVQTYSQPPRDLKMPKITPQIVKIIGLLTRFDELIANVDGMYINGFLRRRARETAINQYRNEIATLIRHLMSLYHDSRDLLKDDASGEFNALLRQRDEGALPERLSDEDEATARQLTGQVDAVELAAEAA